MVISDDSSQVRQTVEASGNTCFCGKYSQSLSEDCLSTATRAGQVIDMYTHIHTILTGQDTENCQVVSDLFYVSLSFAT